MNATVRVRQSLMTLQAEYERGNKAPLEALMRAWKAIKELPSDDPRSFFSLGGLHGEPFRGAGWGNSAYWGGYCNHGNVLFPTWHRVYVLKVEEALRSIPGCEDVTLPYWDETDQNSLNNGVPWALTDENFELDGATIANPLRSFVFPKNIVDHINGDNPNYSKPAGYETVRYPLSGLVGSEDDRAKTAAHNAQFPLYRQNVAILNQNVVNWLNSYIVVDGKEIPTNVNQKFIDCLSAPNYTVFSNTTSVAEWNDNLPNGAKPVVALESPHNSIHLAVGGCDVPGYDRSPIPGANGDMGENDTAGLDPIFYFHHCNIDRVFWLWQKKHGYTDQFDIIPDYPGTNSVDSQGPTPGVTPNSWLTLDSPLSPFKNAANVDYTSKMCFNIETQLGYTYAPGSLEEYVHSGAVKAALADAPMLQVSGINRAPIRGSFMVSAFVTIDGVKQHLGTEAVLSRWNVKYCANCQTHLEVKAHFGLHQLNKDALGKASYSIEIHGRDGEVTPTTQARFLSNGKQLYKMVVR